MKRLILGAAIVVAALGAGGVAYAANNDPAPEQGYVTVEDGSTPSPSSAQQNGRDCPEKNGGGQGQSQSPESEQNPAGNA